jgi:hypothetical protein
MEVGKITEEMTNSVSTRRRAVLVMDAIALWLVS